LENKILKRNKKKERKTMKEEAFSKIKIYDPRGRVIGHLDQGEVVNYQELLLKKGRRFPRSRESPAGKL